MDKRQGRDDRVLVEFRLGNADGGIEIIVRQFVFVPYLALGNGFQAIESNS